MSLRQFSREDFASFHPGGSLGRKLLKVSQVMEFKTGDNLQTMCEDMTVREVLERDPVSGRRAGAVIIVNSAGILSGVFTDGDLRRLVRTGGTGLLDKRISEVMTRNPKRVHTDALASEALATLNKYRIDELPVVDDTGRPVGLVDVQDLVRLRVVE
jgi:arabinose-5-phosphate isomerase